MGINRAAERKAYVIADKSRYLCVTCRAKIKTRREASKHECPVPNGYHEFTVLFTIEAATASQASNILHNALNGVFDDDERIDWQVTLPAREAQS